MVSTLAQPSDLILYFHVHHLKINVCFVGWRKRKRRKRRKVRHWKVQEEPPIKVCQSRAPSKWNKNNDVGSNAHGFGHLSMPAILIIVFCFSSPLEEFTDSWRAEWAQIAVSAQLLPSTPLQSLSTSPLRCLSSLATQAKTWRWRESLLVTCSWPFAETKNLTLWSRLPLLVVVWSPTSTRPWSWRAAKNLEETFTSRVPLCDSLPSAFFQQAATSISL